MRQSTIYYAVHYGVVVGGGGCRAYAAASTPTMRLKVDNSGQGGSGKLGLPAVQCIIQKIHKHEKYTNTSQVDNTAKVGEI